MGVVLFGVGFIYNQNKDLIKNHEEVIALIDNDSNLWGNSIDNCLVYKPEDLENLTYDKIILMSKKSYDMKKQLLEMGIDEKVIWTWENYRKEFLNDEMTYYKSEKISKDKKAKRILIIVHSLELSGSSIAAINLAYALSEKKHEISLAAPVISEDIVKNVNSYGIDVIVIPSLPYVAEKIDKWILGFDIVIVNHFEMFECAYELNGKIPVMIWLHESEYVYKNAKLGWGINNKRIFDFVKVFSVSNVAKKTFEKYFNGYFSEVLTYGIYDIKKVKSSNFKSDKLILAVVGNIQKNKAQLDAVIAFEKLCTQIEENMELWIIGSSSNRQYYCKLEEKVKNNHQIILCGEYSREQLQEAYHNIDIVLCPSLEETMSLVITEGMMYEKVCVVSKTAGISDYIEHGYNGFICEPNNPNQLAELLLQIIKRKQDFPVIGKRARSTYEEYFTMEKFAERADKCVQETIEWFNNQLEPLDTVQN